MKYKYLVVDDEPLARKLIRSHAEKIESLEWAGECANAIDASNFLRTSKVDLLFLDIQMPEMTGLQLAGTLRSGAAIILTTAFRDYAPEAFELNVVDYLLKPISFERFSVAVNKFLDRQQNLLSASSAVIPVQQYLHIRSERKVHRISMDEILYIESLDDYVKVHLTNRVLITRENISTLEEKLPTPPFVRIHRSYLVHTQHISVISGEGVVINKVELPFGRAFKKSALAQLSIKNVK